MELCKVYFIYGQLLSPSLMYLEGHPSCNGHFLLILRKIPLFENPQFVYPFSCWLTFELFPGFVYYD